MKTLLTLFLILTFVTLVLAASATPRFTNTLRAETFETRCGWFSNPTPANAWLLDRDGEWTISVQGGHQAEGDWPEFKPAQWVKTNVNYGYGCACMQVLVNRQTKEVLEIRSAKARPLAKCRQDAALKKWRGKL